jgi:hypothetical protein
MSYNDPIDWGGKQGKAYNWTSGTWEDPHDPNKFSAADKATQYGFTGNAYQENTQGFLDAPTFAHRNDATAVPSLTEQGTQRDILTGGVNGGANLGFYQMNGDPNFANNERNRLLAEGSFYGSRAAPTINTGAVDPLSGQALGAAGAAQGYGTQLATLGAIPAGPSVAELAMQRSAAQQQQAQASLAASARGGNAALALQNAGANQAQIGGQLTQDLGVQRAQEDLANRTFAANALSGAAGINQNAAGIYGNQAGLYGGFAQQNAGNFLNQEQLNQAGQMGYDAQGNAIIGQQTSNNIAFDQNKANNYINQLRANQGQEALNQSAQAASLAERDKWINTGLTAAAGLASGGATLIAQGGASAAKAGIDGANGSTSNPQLASDPELSDMRAKKDIRPATGDVSAAFRTADQNVAALQAPTNYGVAPSLYPRAPAYAYNYRDPNAAGAEPGRQYGIMAQDLEKTPAGASVVGEKNGRKYIDPNRLSLMTAAEVARQRQELDALMNSRGPAAQIQQAPVAYPQPSLYQ